MHSLSERQAYSFVVNVINFSSPEHQGLKHSCLSMGVSMGQQDAVLLTCLRVTDLFGNHRFIREVEKRTFL